MRPGETLGLAARAVSSTRPAVKSAASTDRELNVSFNPYKVLRVPQQASADDITAAYRPELPTAARLGALRTA